MGFLVATEEDIKSGKVTDVYFRRVSESLKSRGINPHVSMEVRANSLPQEWGWAVFAGLEELLELTDELPVSVRSLDEGEVFKSGEPVLSVTGEYLDFGVYETAMLGLVCQASGVATRAARCKLAAKDRMLVSFGARRMHPAISPMIERNAFVGGCDGVAVVESAHLIGEEPVGTMSHTLILCAQDERVAFEAFDEVVDPEVKRVALVDTFQDEKFGALYAAEVLGEKLFAVRLDTPGSRRGSFEAIMDEVRWELDTRGYEQVKLFLSGGLNEYGILRYNPWADAYGVGTHISNAPVLDYSMDIVELDGEPLAKRGKKSGLKQLWRCPACRRRCQTLAGIESRTCEDCGAEMEALIKDRATRGHRLIADPNPRQIRKHTLERISTLEL